MKIQPRGILVTGHVYCLGKGVKKKKRHLIAVAQEENKFQICLCCNLTQGGYACLTILTCFWCSWWRQAWDNQLSSRPYQQKFVHNSVAWMEDSNLSTITINKKKALLISLMSPSLECQISAFNFVFQWGIWKYQMKTKAVSQFLGCKPLRAHISSTWVTARHSRLSQTVGTHSADCNNET